MTSDSVQRVLIKGKTELEDTRAIFWDVRGHHLEERSAWCVLHVTMISGVNLDQEAVETPSTSQKLDSQYGCGSVLAAA